MVSPLRIEELEAEVAINEDENLIPVHISPEEVMAFNALQGGQRVDKQTGLREYSALSDILRDPDARNLFITVMDVLKSGEPIPEDIENLMSDSLDAIIHEVKPIESDYDTEIQAMSDVGEGADKFLVMLPNDVASFFDIIRGGKKTDPALGLQEFWIPLAIGAAMLVGSMFMGQKAEQEKQKDQERMNRNRRKDISEARKQEMGYWDTPFSMDVNGTYGVKNTIVEGSPRQTDTSREGPIKPQSNTNMMKSMGVIPGIMPTNGIPSNKPRAKFGSIGSFFGFKKGDKVSLKKYKNGGHVIGSEITGRGKGQDDFIPKTVKENSWVWDATTVGHAGDGATNAGQKAIEAFEKKIQKEHLPHHHEDIKITIKKQPLRDVPCALSNGERVTPPKLVAALGEGSFDKGAAIMRKMTKELRKHKISKGDDLPPAAHDLTVYYKKALSGR